MEYRIAFDLRKRFTVFGHGFLLHGLSSLGVSLLGPWILGEEPYDQSDFVYRLSIEEYSASPFPGKERSEIFLVRLHEEGQFHTL